MRERENKERSYHKSAYKIAIALDALLKESYLIHCVMQTIIKLSDQCLGGEMHPFAEKSEEQCKIWEVLGTEQLCSTIFLPHTFLVASCYC